MLYHYRVKSKDAAGNLAVSGDFTFTTAQNGSVAIKWLVTDHLGSTRMVIDETGSLAGITRHDFAPFGEELFAGVGVRATDHGYASNTQQDGQRVKFDGYERDDETGLDFAQARYYSNMLGRFTSPDPLIASAILDDPQSWNRYSFVGNRPLVYIDPTGLQWGRSRETGEYQWFQSGVVDEGWDKVNIGQEYDSVNGRVVLQAGGYWDYVRPPQAGINVFRDSQLTNSMMMMLGGSWLFGSGLGVGVAAGSIAAADLLPMATAGTAHFFGIGEEGGGSALTTEPGRGGAFAEAKRDAGIPVSQQPDSVSRVRMTDMNGKSVLGENGQPIMTREYLFTRADGSQVIIQDHSAGHNFGQGGRGNQGPHFNVRQVNDPRHGVVPGTRGHYPFRR